jgi:hypothetical protein
VHPSTAPSALLLPDRLNKRLLPQFVGLLAHSHSHVFCLNVVWRVHWLLIDEATFVLIQGTTYGRYHAISLTIALCCPV